MWIVILAIIFIIIGFLCIWLPEKNREINKRLDAEEMERQKQYDALKKEKDQKALTILEEKYGKLTAQCRKLGFEVSVFNDTNIVIINDEPFSFNEISECYIREERLVTPGHSTTTYTTKTSGSSMAGRALVGAIVAGPIGAVIGGATAKRQTVGETVTTPDVVKYKYYVTIGINKEGCQDIVYDTNFKDRAEEIKRIIDDIMRYSKNM